VLSHLSLSITKDFKRAIDRSTYDEYIYNVISKKKLKKLTLIQKHTLLWTFSKSDLIA